MAAHVALLLLLPLTAGTSMFLTEPSPSRYPGGRAQGRASGKDYKTSCLLAMQRTRHDCTEVRRRTAARESHRADVSPGARQAFKPAPCGSFPRLEERAFRTVGRKRLSAEDQSCSCGCTWMGFSRRFLGKLSPQNTAAGLASTLRASPTAPAESAESLWSCTPNACGLG
ncbi:unnamed protein product [Symbiodinium natans]|uniref:Uncharacterized protein n=1 Tax=Symbiodinium natans TaxID=878477 RepID=A0A812HRN9_9DINO|nr:unnamed protein product [Symbiodinium natans]